MCTSGLFALAFLTFYWVFWHLFSCGFLRLFILTQQSHILVPWLYTKTNITRQLLDSFSLTAQGAKAGFEVEKVRMCFQGRVWRRFLSWSHLKTPCEVVWEVKSRLCHWLSLISGIGAPTMSALGWFLCCCLWASDGRVNVATYFTFTEKRINSPATSDTTW